MVDKQKVSFYNDVKNDGKGGKDMRKTYLDNIRWITVVLVVIYHVIYMFNGVTTYGVIGPFRDFQPQDVYQYIVYPWFMLLLFVVSGMSARFEVEKKTSKAFIKDRTRKYLVPSTIGLLVFEWILGYYNMLIGGAFEQMGAVPKPVLYIIMAVSGTGVLWYIQLLWVFSLVLVLVRKVEKDRLYQYGERAGLAFIIALVVVIYLAAQILNTPVVVVYRFGIYGAGFFIGYFIFSHDKVMDRVERGWIILTLLAVVSGILYVIMYWGQSYPDHEVLDTVMCNVFAWFGTLGVLAFMKKWGEFENAFTKWMCQKSWGLYVFHYLPIAVVAYYLTQLQSTFYPFVIYALVAIAGFAGSFILYEIISRIPILRWCILGIKSKKKEV